jgi:hypothetical protein
MIEIKEEQICGGSQTNNVKTFCSVGECGLDLSGHSLFDFWVYCFKGYVDLNVILPTKPEGNP